MLCRTPASWTPFPVIRRPLLGEDLSNRDVAARLTLSVRTVEGHIYQSDEQDRYG
jgi:hypothetical protein